MYLKTKSGRLVELPSEEEAAAIDAGIAADADTYELSDEEFLHLRRPTGMSPSSTSREYNGIPIDADVLEGFKSTGCGWQTRINEILRKWLKEHPSENQPPLR